MSVLLVWGAIFGILGLAVWLGDLVAELLSLGLLLLTIGKVIAWTCF